MKSTRSLLEKFASGGTVAVLVLGLALACAMPAAAASYTYVTSGNDGTVSVIDTETNKVVATIPVGASPFAVAVTPNGKSVYVTNFYGSSVSMPG